MTKCFVILLVFGLYEVCSICFIKQKTIENWPVIDQPKAVDEYHCKIICAERKECFSFAFTGNRCKLFGSAKVSSSSTIEGAEWRNVKKTSDNDCRDSIKQPLITKEYSPNSAITYLTELDEFEIEFDTWQPCLRGWMLEVILPGNTYRIEGDTFNHIHWDGKIGSWILTKKTEQSNTNTTLFIRAARCFLIMPELYEDLTSCGGSLPKLTAVEDGRVIGTPIRRYGDLFGCLGFRYITDFDSRAKTFHSNEHALVCIDGAWIYLKRSIGKDILNAWKILKGICV